MVTDGRFRIMLYGAVASPYFVGPAHIPFTSRKRSREPELAPIAFKFGIGRPAGLTASGGSAGVGSLRPAVESSMPSGRPSASASLTVVLKITAAHVRHSYGLLLA